MTDCTTVLNVEAFEAEAARSLPKVAYDYYRSGAWGEHTLAENIAAWQRLWLRPRCMVDVSGRDTGITLLGQRLPAPLLLAPTAMHQMAHADGEVATARAAGACGVPMVLSSLSTCTVEAVAQATSAPLWMQIYISQDRGFTRALAQRAQAAGCKALMVTVDTPVWGVRERDIHNGFRVPDGMRMANLERPGMPTGHSGSGIGAALGWTIDASLTWKDLEMLRAAVNIPVLVKGVLRGDDAVKAIEHGAAGVVVSNHGGRQLDGAVAPATALPEVVQKVSGGWWHPSRHRHPACAGAGRHGGAGGPSGAVGPGRCGAARRGACAAPADGGVLARHGACRLLARERDHFGFDPRQTLTPGPSSVS